MKPAGYGKGTSSGLLTFQTRPPRKCLICDFCSSDREFALGLLQIPPHNGHPCPQLTLPTAKRVADFHRLVTAHFGQTQKTARTLPVPARLFIRIYYAFLTILPSLFLGIEKATLLAWSPTRSRIVSISRNTVPFSALQMPAFILPMWLYL